nr:DUF6012 family protein [Klebsiella quasipneumoniae]
MIGLLLEYDKQVSHFTTQYKWYIEDIGIVQHNIKTIVLDCDFDLISQYIGLNIGLDEFKPRLHHSYHNAAPVKIQPMMESYRTGEPVNKLHHDVWENNVLLLQFINRQTSPAKLCNLHLKILNAAPV